MPWEWKLNRNQKTQALLFHFLCVLFCFKFPRSFYNVENVKRTATDLKQGLTARYSVLSVNSAG